MQVARYAALPGQAFLPGSIQPIMELPNTLGDLLAKAHRSKGRHDSHLPPEYERNLRASEITLAEAMRDAGYKTFFAGKWHLGSKGSWPTDHGFDINKGGFDAGGPRGGFFAPYQNPNLKSAKGESLTIRLGQETADFIESQKDQATLPSLPLLLHRARPHSNHRSPL